MEKRERASLLVFVWTLSLLFFAAGQTTQAVPNGGYTHLKQMKLLDGGIDGWKAKGFSIEMTSPKMEKTRFRLKGETKARKPLLCTLPEVKSALKKPDQVVLDVRTKKEYVGEEIKKGATRGGRISGVTWIEWKETILEEGPYKGYWKSAEGIRKIFSTKECLLKKIFISTDIPEYDRHTVW